MPAESKKLDTKCPESFGGKSGGLSFAATHSDALKMEKKCNNHEALYFYVSIIISPY